MYFCVPYEEAMLTASVFNSILNRFVNRPTMQNCYSGYRKKSKINLCMIMFGHDRRIIRTHHVCTNFEYNSNYS